ncbi:MAG: DUF123 domain-containing protein [Melioribacteraceae bacterium]|nr:DUF123 domain-containing protein [Melioribacteraceae bacterium]
MRITTNISSGIYILEIYSRKKFGVNHPKFEKVNFAGGYYYYIGSAQKNFISRINRHLSSKKKLRWHIDYLLDSENCTVKKVYAIENNSKNLECELVGKISSSIDIITHINGFGNSDCKKCKSHLIYSKTKINYSHFCSLYQATVCLIPSSKEIS